MNTEGVRVLASERVQTIFLDCLSRDDDDTDDRVVAEGVISTVGFNPSRLDDHRGEIGMMLDELPDQFKASGGGGWSFLNACDDKHGTQWTGMHQRVEQLVQLGIAVGKIRYLLPRDMWDALPGGMPYFVVVDR